jgi:hypothetical protein
VIRKLIHIGIENHDFIAVDAPSIGSITFAQSGCKKPISVPSMADMYRTKVRLRMGLVISTMV